MIGRLVSFTKLSDTVRDCCGKCDSDVCVKTL